ncbi:hypothetical protein HK101_003417 [Irineochytrium annulatum]|nr:hypothetical protein HK101_003417 [Irineochytrium annulatum]
MIATAAAVALLAIGAVADYTALNGFKYSATLADAQTAQVTITGPLAADTWVGWGIPNDPTNPDMLSSELIIIFPNTTGVTLQVGRAIRIETPVYHPITPQSEVVLNTDLSSYTNGVLTAVFTRPITGQVIGTGTQTSNIVSGTSSYLWASGPVVAGAPNAHSPSGRGIASNVNIFSSAATSSASSGSTTAPAATSSVPVVTTSTTKTAPHAPARPRASAANASAMITESQASVPGYAVIERIETRKKPTLFIQRARSLADPSIRVVCKSSLIADEDDNRRTEREYEILKLIHDHHDAARATAARAAAELAGGVMATLVDDGTKRVVRAVELVNVDGSFVLIMRDFGGVSLRQLALWEVDELGCGRVKALSCSDAALGAASTPSVEVNAGRWPAEQKPVVARRLSIEACVDVAVQLAEALHVIHAAHVVHKDINPDNIVGHRSGRGDNDKVEVQLIDFNLAEVLNENTLNETRGDAASSTSAQERKGMHGTLPYMSPEQTGRMNRAPDHRSDFYSLGITLWELLIGEPPFKCNDAMEYVHCHLAKEIDPVHTVDPQIPLVLSSIISKSVEKAPENRYQSALGFWSDLTACARRIASHRLKAGIAETAAVHDADMPVVFAGFEYKVASRDFSRTIQMPVGRLYGRAEQQKVMFETFERVKAGGEQSEIIVLEGPYGSGKNTLMAASVMDFIKRGGRFARGSYSTESSTPLEGVLQMVAQLVRQSLSKSNTNIDTLKRALADSFGAESARRLLNHVPELGVLLAEPVELKANDLSVQDCTTKLEADLQALITLVASEGQLPVLFFDKIELADKFTFSLLERILAADGVPPVLIIASATEKASAATENHYLTRLLKKYPSQTRRLLLPPLSISDVKELLSDVLQPTQRQFDALATVIFRKTMGIPLYILQSLQICQANYCIFVDDEKNEWTWDIDKIENSVTPTENVIDHIISQIDRMPPKTKTLLQIAACVGEQFDIRLLMKVSNLNAVSITFALSAPMISGLIASMPGVTSLSAPGESDVCPQSLPTGMINMYKFCHDRIAQAVLATLDTDERISLHLKIGGFMKEVLGPVDDISATRILRLARHFNEAFPLIDDAELLVYVTRVNCLAAIAFLSLSSPKQAKTHIDWALMALSRASAEPWQDRYRVWYDVEYTHAKCLLHLGMMEDCERTVKGLLARVVEAEDRIRAILCLTNLFVFQMRAGELVNLHKEELKDHGVILSDDREELKAIVEREMDITSRILMATTADEIMARNKKLSPLAESVQMLFANGIRAAIRVNDILTAGAFAAAAIRNGLTHGFGEAGCEVLTFGQICFLYPSSPPRFAEIIMLDDLCERLMATALPESVQRSHYIRAGYTYPFIKSADEVLSKVQRGTKLAREAGNTTSICFCVIVLLDYGMTYGLPGSYLSDIQEKYGKLVIQFGGFSLVVMNTAIAFAKAWSTGDDTCLPPVKENAKDQYESGFVILHLRTAVIFDRPTQRRLLDLVLEKPEWYCSITIKLLDVFMCAIIIAGKEWECSADEVERAAKIDFAKMALTKMKTYTDQQKQSHFRYCTGLAEIARMEGDLDAAIENYELAITEAHDAGFRMYEAMVNELYGQFWRHRGSLKMARACMTDAFNIWVAWGSEGKCQQMIQKYGDLVAVGRAISAGGSCSVTQNRKSMKKFSHAHSKSSKTVTSHDDLELDVLTVMKVAQSLRNETSLEALLRRIMTYAMINAGATKGVLALNDNGILTIEAAVVVDEDGEEEVVVLQALPIDTADERSSVPLSVVQFVYRSKEAVVLSDPPADQTHGLDDYVKRNRPLSILCCPIVHHSSVTGVVYLENNLQKDAFTPSRIDLIQSLMPPASMSIENARLTKANTELTEALRVTTNHAGAPKYNIDAPVKRAIDILQDVKTKLAQSNDPDASKVDYILTTLTSADMFASSMDEINDENGKGVDLETKLWIENSLLQRAPKLKGSGRGDSREQMMMTASVRNGPKASWRSLKSTTSEEQLSATFEVSFDAELDSQEMKEKEISFARRRQESITVFNFASTQNVAEINQYLDENLYSIDFDIFRLQELTDGQPLFFLSVHLLEKYDLISSLKINEDRARAFFRSVEKNYKPQPFHNRPEMNIFESFSVDDKKAIRKMVVNMIIATVWSQCISIEVSQQCLQNIATNRAYWESILATPELVPEIPKRPAIPIELKPTLDASTADRAVKRRSTQRGSISGTAQSGSPAMGRTRRLSQKFRAKGDTGRFTVSSLLNKRGKNAVNSAQALGSMASLPNSGASSSDSVQSTDRRRTDSADHKENEKTSAPAATKGPEGDSIFRRAKASLGFTRSSKVGDLPVLPKPVKAGKERPASAGGQGSHVSSDVGSQESKRSM